MQDRDRLTSTLTQKRNHFDNRSTKKCEAVEIVFEIPLRPLVEPNPIKVGIIPNRHHPNRSSASPDRNQIFFEPGEKRVVSVEQVPLVEVPIGYVGVGVSYVGREHLDVSGESFTHGDLVERGRKGVWVEPLLPGKHPLNTKVMKVELVPTTNIVLNWAQRSEAHHYDERLSSILVRSKDGFSFSQIGRAHV